MWGADSPQASARLDVPTARVRRKLGAGALRAERGVGLALVARIARAHGGSAAFADAPVGARLVVRLPRWTP